MPVAQPPNPPAAKGRPRPAIGWRLPAVTLAALWLVLFVWTAQGGDARAALDGWAAPVAALLHLPYGVILVFLALGLVVRLGYLSRGRTPRAPGTLPGYTPLVCVQLPMFNEDAVAARVIEAAARMRWPAGRLEIQVLDDSTDPILRAHVRATCARVWNATGVPVRWIHRTDRTGYKAGALEAGRRMTAARFIAILDADFVPPADFLERAIPHFYDRDGQLHDDLALVQAQWGHLNDAASPLTGAQAMWVDDHHTLQMAWRSEVLGFVNFTGTAGIWRADAIRDAGGWRSASLVEDCELSMRALFAGWRTTFVGQIVVPAELPGSVAAYRLQQKRWTQGWVQLQRLHLRTLATRYRTGLGRRTMLLYLMCIGWQWPLWAVWVGVLPFLIAQGLWLGAFGTGTALAVYLAPALGFALFAAGLYTVQARATYAGRNDLAAQARRFLRVGPYLVVNAGMLAHHACAFLEGLFGPMHAEFERRPKTAAVTGSVADAPVPVPVAARKASPTAVGLCPGRSGHGRDARCLGRALPDAGPARRGGRCVVTRPLRCPVARRSAAEAGAVRPGAAGARARLTAALAHPGRRREAAARDGQGGQAMAGLERRIAAGRGDVPADMVLRGGQVFDLMTGAMIAGDVAIVEDTIVGIGADYDAPRVIDVTGLTLVPGFIDTHLHVESSLITPREFDRCVTPRGITTAICDPHEIANVLGAEGVRWFQRASEGLLMDLRVQLSSCVPSTHMETAGAELTAADIAALRGHPSGIGLAEFMNYPGVIHRDPAALEKLALFQGGHIDGHAPLLTGRDLNAYVAAGIRTEHEATSAAEAREKLQRGMRVLIREGSVSKDMVALQPLLTDITAPWMCLCTDDRNPLDIAEHGHLDHMIRTLIALGSPVLAVYRAASLSGAEAFGLRDRGLIAPGRRADIVALPDLRDCRAALVIAGGRVVDDAAFAARAQLAPVGRGSVKAPRVTAQDFRHRGNRTATDVIGILPGKILTEHLHEDIAIVDGDKTPDPARDLMRIAVIERHGRNGNIATGFVRGFGMQAGAIASTVCHDHHNIAVVGADYADMALAANRLSVIEGGFVVVRDGTVLAELALPVAGLMSLDPFEGVHTRLIALRAAARSLGVTLEEPFLQLAFLALPVIPALKITDRGMVDVTRFEIIGAG